MVIGVVRRGHGFRRMVLVVCGESAWPKNVRLENSAVHHRIDATALRLEAHLREKYYDHYAMTLCIADVEVLRPDKFWWLIQ